MIIKGQLNQPLAKQIVAIVGEVSAAQLSDAIEVLHDDGSELSDDEQIRLRGVIAAQGLPHTETQQKAIEARALVTVRREQVAEAESAWRSALAAAGESISTTDAGDPEVEWDSPDDEAEAANDLAVAYLGGQVMAARHALDVATRVAKSETILAMREAARLGREAWRRAHI